jgi:putative addiction module component (TIGR02574 family)
MDEECNGTGLELKWTTRGSVARGSNQRYNHYMTQQALELLQKALALPEEERAALVRSLIESLEEVADQGTERAWDEEIARRIADLDSGKSKTVSWEEIRQRISARLAHER